jgi:hypothetical protein
VKQAKVSKAKVSEIPIEATMAEVSDKTGNEAGNEVGNKGGMSKHE